MGIKLGNRETCIEDGYYILVRAKVSAYVSWFFKVNEKGYVKQLNKASTKIIQFVYFRNFIYRKRYDVIK